MSDTRTVALNLIRRAVLLFHQGTGIVIEPLDDLGPIENPFIEDINDEGTRYWAEQLLYFARQAHDLLTRILLEDEAAYGEYMEDV